MTQLQYWLCVFIMPHGSLEWIYTLRLLNVKEIFAWNRGDIWKLNEYIGIWTTTTYFVNEHSNI